MAGLQLPNPPASSPAVRAVMRANRARDTGPERRLRKALREAGLGGYRLNWKKAPGRPDIAYPGERSTIFVHGCYWHHCPRCYPNLPKSNPEFWARKFELNRERDARKRRESQLAAWVVIEACGVPRYAGDIGSVTFRVRAAVDSSRRPGTPSNGRQFPSGTRTSPSPMSPACSNRRMAGYIARSRPSGPAREPCRIRCRRHGDD